MTEDQKEQAIVIYDCLTRAMALIGMYEEEATQHVLRRFKQQAAVGDKVNQALCQKAYEFVEFVFEQE